ncbi:glutamate-5-semialdehyde dehydrogenase [Candidatus Methanoprimaticola sp. MG2]|uniref:glutamate-5-semialdehyde dehydrogenase n=1 Tax=Candidatus Methanoprimaticola sp. MG2 TaxID=3228838 RepID=UPI0039C6EAF0
MMTDIIAEVKAAKTASILLSSVPTSRKDAALDAMANALDAAREDILRANAIDLEKGRRLVDSGEISASMYKRLAIDDSKIDGMIAGIRDVMSLGDPVGEVMSALDLDDGLTLYQIRCPIGMLGVIFESRPDVVPQIMSLCLKSGNGVAFKGGREASESIRTLFAILRDAASSAGIPAESFVLMESRDDINAILGLHDYIDLLIPRGSNDFVRYIQENTRIPVLGHAAGICHVYVDGDADLDMACSVVLDSKIQYPAVCNAAETLLVDSRVAGDFLPRMASLFEEKGVEMRGDPRTLEIISVKEAREEDWDTEYGDLTISIRIVDSIEEAIGFINSHGSHHTDAIVTRDMSRASRFVAGVDSADVFVNASTRFADGFRYGKGAEVGISTNKIHARGPVGMEGLMIYKYVLIGNGQVVRDYAGPGAKGFKHVPSSEIYPFGGE